MRGFRPIRPHVSEIWRRRGGECGECGESGGWHDRRASSDRCETRTTCCQVFAHTVYTVSSRTGENWGSHGHANSRGRALQQRQHNDERHVS